MGYSPWDHKESDVTEQLTTTTKKYSYQFKVEGSKCRPRWNTPKQSDVTEQLTTTKEAYRPSPYPIKIVFNLEC